MEVDIRLATWYDVDPFMELWEDYLISHERLGSDIRATEKTIGFFKELLLAYLDGDFLGVPLMAWVGEEPVGVLLWGQLPPAPFDRVEERCVTDFGTFTALRFRCMGVGTALRERVILELDAKGIRSVLGSVMMTNRAGVESARAIGFVPSSANGTIDIPAAAAAIRSGTPVKRFYWEGNCPLCGGE